MRIDYLSRIISGLLIFISLNVHGNPYQDKDMKDLTVKKINVDTISVEEIPALFKREHIAYQTIANVNWKDSYPYCPQVEFGIAYTDKAILLHYQVTEESVRAVAGHDNGPVWEDACVEFFSMPGGDDIYYNVECNCTGTLLVGAGATRSNRQHAPHEVLDRVSRWLRQFSHHFFRLTYIMIDRIVIVHSEIGIQQICYTFQHKFRFLLFACHSKCGIEHLSGFVVFLL